MHLLHRVWLKAHTLLAVSPFEFLSPCPLVLVRRAGDIIHRQAGSSQMTGAPETTGGVRQPSSPAPVEVGQVMMRMFDGHQRRGRHHPEGGGGEDAVGLWGRVLVGMGGVSPAPAVTAS